MPGARSRGSTSNTRDGTRAASDPGFIAQPYHTTEGSHGQDLRGHRCAPAGLHREAAGLLRGDGAARRARSHQPFAQGPRQLPHPRPRRVAYLDLTGSGVETIAHLRENGRIVLMFCAFAGPPKILRLHGRGSVFEPGHPDFAALRARFPEHAGVRSVIAVEVERIADSCGYGIPVYEFVGERDTLAEWAGRKTDAELDAYRAQNNARSIDGLPGLQRAE